MHLRAWDRVELMHAHASPHLYDVIGPLRICYLNPQTCRVVSLQFKAKLRSLVRVSNVDVPYFSNFLTLRVPLIVFESRVTAPQPPLFILSVEQAQSL